MSPRLTHRVFCVLALLALVFQPLSAVAVAAPPRNGPDPFATGIHPVDPQHPGFLFRALIPVKTDRDLARIEAAGALVLRSIGEDGSRTAFVLADGDRLADLVRLGFRPQTADELRLLVTAQGREKAWLARSLVPLLEKSDALEAVRERDVVGDLTSDAEAPHSPEATQAMSDLHSAISGVTAEQQAGIADSVSVDDDADGLTNTQEAWWCTDPLNPNSDGDASGYTDGTEVSALLDFTLSRTVRWGYGAPFGPPNTWPNFNDRDGTHTRVCNDGDYDTIPDYAEAYMVGTRTPDESTDRDKFDDGQELFGTTFCPGGTATCGYGSYPRIEYWNYIQADMPSWVLPPGDNPLVAAFPQPEISVTPGSWHVERVASITTTEGQMTEQSHSYETSVTRGQSSSTTDTVDWNDWEEVSEAVETPVGRAHSLVDGKAYPNTTLEYDFGKAVGASLKVTGGEWLIEAGIVGIIAGCIGTAGAGCAVATTAGGVAVSEGWNLIKSGLQDDWEMLFPPNQAQDESGANKYDAADPNSITSVTNVSSSASANASVVVNENMDYQSVSDSLDGVQYAINQNGDLIARSLNDIAYAIARPRYTETRTTGESWGGSQSTTHEDFEQHTVSQGEAFTDAQNWSTAWAIDSTHVADLTFAFTVRNIGTEYASELSELVISVYLGKDTSPSVSYPAWQKFPSGKITNLFPVGPNTPPGGKSSETYVTDPIPLTLEQMKRIDSGEALTVKVERYAYGSDQLFYTHAVSGGCSIYIEDGIEDGDEGVDRYVIPTWGNESVQDVVERYFRCPSGRTCTDAEGRLNALWTPEFDGTNPPTWHEHYLSDVSWWNIYLSQPDAGNAPLNDIPAQPGSAILFRFNRDSDRDGCNDRAEFRYYCALPASSPERQPDGAGGPDYCLDGYQRANVHPKPEVLAGAVIPSAQNGVVTVTLALENTGTFDAYGIDAVMVSPDDTTTITNNTIGGNGRVRPGAHVAVGSLIKPPDLTYWGESTSKPYSGGQFSGDADTTYTFTVETGGTVGQGSTSIHWSNGTTSGVLALGSTYHAPLPIDVEKGVQVGFNTGTMAAGARFTVDALTPRDTFTYHINSEPATPPIIIVSYSDPQGSHRFVTPVKLSSLGDNLTPYAGQMLPRLRLEIQATGPFAADGTNTSHVLLNNPSVAQINAGRVHINFVSDGKLVLEKTRSLDIPPGPTVLSVDWAAFEFSADYNPEGDNILIAFWTDSEENIVDSAARPFRTFATDPTPTFSTPAGDQTWDFGTAKQGTLLRSSFTVANTGLGDLLLYVSAPSSVSVTPAGGWLVGAGDTAAYTMTVNTAALPFGPFDATVAIRTNDPDQPATTATVHGVVTEPDLTGAGGEQAPAFSGPQAPLSDYEAICDDQGACFSHSGEGWADMWGGNTYAGHAWRTYGVGSPPVDWAGFTPPLQYSGRYHVQRWNPSYSSAPITQSAHVTIHSPEWGDQYIVDNQQDSPGTWKAIGSPTRCLAGSSCSVRITDETHEGWHETRVLFDAIRFWATWPNPIIDSGVTIVGDSTVVTGSSVKVQFRVHNTGDLDWSSSEVHARATGPVTVDFPNQAMGLQYDWANTYEQSAVFSQAGTYSICGGYGYFTSLGGNCAQLQVITSSDPKIISGVDIIGDATVTPGEDVTLRYTVRNDGQQTWTRSDLRAQATGPVVALFPPHAVSLSYQQIAVYEDSLSFNGPGAYTICGGYGDFVPLGGGTCATVQVMQLEQVRYVRLAAEEYADVALTFEFGSGTGTHRVDLDVGGDETVDWSSSGSGQQPVRLTTGNLAAAFNTYLQGRSGNVDVPLHFIVSALPLDLEDFTATPSHTPDLTLATSDLNFDAPSPVEGDVTVVSAKIHNNGTRTAAPSAVAFWATSPGWGDWYIGSALVPDIPAGSTASARIEWNTLGFNGDTPVHVRVDPANRLPESNEGNNEATKNLTIKTRPDLRVKQIDLSNPEPMAGESVTVKVTLRNDGQTAAGASHLVLYDGNPDTGGAQLADASVGVAAGAETAVELPWNPTAAGGHKLFARSDLDRQVSESDEANNDGWRDVYAGLASPLLIDSGAGPVYDPAYTPDLGFGYLGGQDAACGTDVASTQRSSGSSDTLQYRFDHLLPGHFYHLDLTLSECDGLGRQEMISIDDNIINDGVTLTAGTPSRLSFRLDPAFYADRSITVSVRELSGYDALIAEINLYDIDYRYSDSGHSSSNLDPYDPIYPAAPPGRPERKYGWLDGQMNQPTGWGTLPYQTRRIDLGDTDPSDDPDKELRYRFDGLRSTLHYQLRMSFWIKTGSTVKHNIGVDDIGTGVTVETAAGQPPSNIVVDVPPGAYTNDGSVVVKITRAEAGVTAGAFVNEIALEELTLLPETESQVTQVTPLHTGEPNWFSFSVKPPVRPAASCTGVTATTAFTTLYGDAVLGVGPVPVGALVEAFNPSGVKTGCFKVSTDGKYGYMRVYGAEGSTPGLAAGDPIILKVNGIAATPTPYPLIWQDDKGTREVDLNAPDLIPVETLLAPISDKVTKLQCENGTYLPPPADPRFNTCTTVEPGRMYLIWVNAAADLTVTGNRVTADRPLVLHTGYNWLGYLPTCELTVATALGGIPGQYDLLYSETGTYLPPPADPVYNTFNSMAPGRGYMIHMTEAATLTYPAGLCGGAK